MSELKSVFLFFLILVGFIVLIAFIFGRLTWPFGNRNTTTVAVSVTPTPTPAPAKECRFFGLFCKPVVTPTPASNAATPTPAPTYVVNQPTIHQGNTVGGVTTIPETGNPTLLLLIPGALATAGVWMKRKSK